jgi:hypothetical protein
MGGPTSPPRSAAAALNGAASTRADSGGISGPSPDISPAARPSPSRETVPQTAERTVGQAADASASSPGLQLTAGLIAAALAAMLAMTRLFAAGAPGRDAVERETTFPERRVVSRLSNPFTVPVARKRTSSL